MATKKEETMTAEETAMASEMQQNAETFSRFFSKKLSQQQKFGLGQVSATLDKGVQMGVKNSIILGKALQKVDDGVSEDLGLKTIARVLRGASLDVEHMRQTKSGCPAPRSAAVAISLFDTVVQGWGLPAQPRLMAENPK